MNRYLLLLVSLCTMLSSCATPTNPYYHETSTNMPYATISGYEAFFSPSKKIQMNLIDDRTVLIVGSLNDNIKISPEWHTIEVYIQFTQLGFIEDTKTETAVVNLRFKAKPNIKYAIDAKVEGDNIIAWIKDSKTNIRVSEVAKSNYLPAHSEELQVSDLPYS